MNVIDTHPGRRASSGRVRVARRGERGGGSHVSGQAASSAHTGPTTYSNRQAQLIPQEEVMEQARSTELNVENSRRMRKERRHRGHRGRVSMVPRAINSQAEEGSLKSRSTENGDHVSKDAASVTSEQHEFRGPDGSSNELRAEAQEFVPAYQHDQSLSTPAVEFVVDPNSMTQTHPPKAKKVIYTSTAPDITARTHEDIANGVYECPICTNELGRRSRVWSCKLCWAVFHLSCIKKWSKDEGSVFQDRQPQVQHNDNGITALRKWRCPGCNLPQDTLPTIYSCWCEKDLEPQSLPGLPPHSCGQTCSRPRKACSHPCSLTCHAGPCPPCTAMGPAQDCFCGRKMSRKRCADTDYVNGWSCGRICGDLMPCGKHPCPRSCHEGFCGACEVKVGSTCYCGKVKTQMSCSTKDEEIVSQRLQSNDLEVERLEEWIGSFCCETICNRSFDCGIHSCQKICHPQDAHPPHCPRSPDVVLNCVCGKTPLSEIDASIRRVSCQDPIPNCSKPCGKVLNCGHQCLTICHSGLCQPCVTRMSISCRCGRGSFDTICHQGKEELPHCFRMCKASMNCGRHSCTERCCPGERKALERQATKRKLKSLNASNRSMDDDIEAEHICTRICGRTLNCGKHTCPELCHKGPCASCREAIFEEIRCHCGSSVLYPPLPCGTTPPSCEFQCERPKVCGHPQTPHDCHPDDESCPKCPFLMEKRCTCEKKILKNQPCWLADPRCGLVCGKTLKCGSHTCLKNCHRLGECKDATTPCQQPCGKSKTLCGHPCTEPCHAPYACPEKAPCSTIVTVTCHCGRLRWERSCHAARAVTSKGQLQQLETLPSLKAMNCDDECARLERNRALASALKIDINSSTTVAKNISPSNFSPTNLPYSTETLDMYIQLSSSSTLTALQNYESVLHSLAARDTERSVRFQPARAPLRAFIHSLAADWGFISESFDPEPHRHVLILKPTRWNPPVHGFGKGSAIGISGMTVGECVKLREREKLKEREARRTAATELKSVKDVTSLTEGGWAQVASRRRPGVDPNITPASTGTNTPVLISGTTYVPLAVDVAKNKKGSTLVLRSGVSTGKILRSKAKTDDDVADSWEEEVAKEEEAERQEIEDRSHEQHGFSGPMERDTRNTRHDLGANAERSESLSIPNSD